jgi:hypothetical protein
LFRAQTREKRLQAGWTFAGDKVSVVFVFDSFTDALTVLLVIAPRACCWSLRLMLGSSTLAVFHHPIRVWRFAQASPFTRILHNVIGAEATSVPVVFGERLFHLLPLLESLRS